MGGRRIDDQSNWVGKTNTSKPFPDGCKMKSISEVDGAGELGVYQDTEEKIASNQRMSVSKMKSNKQRDGYRN